MAYLQLRSQLRLTAELGAFVGQVQGVDSMLLIVQVTALHRTTPIEGWPRAADLALRLHLTGQGCHAYQRLPRGEVGSEGVLHVHSTSQIKRAAYRCMRNGGVKVEALHLHLLGIDFKVNVRRVQGNLPQA